jgi:hypothetical protein
MARYAATENGQHPYGETKDRYTTRSEGEREFERRVANGSQHVVLTVFWDRVKSATLKRSG